MTLKPIPGAPIDAPIPEFPIGNPGPLAVPASHLTHRPAGPLPNSLPLPPLSPARQPGRVEVRGDDANTLTFQVIPEIPAINRSSLTISVTGKPLQDHSPRTMPHLDLATDEAKAFLQALRDGDPPIVIADGRTAFQIEFAVAEDGPTFTVTRPGRERIARRFNAGWSYDVKAMAAQLLADLGP